MKLLMNITACSVHPSQALHHRKVGEDGNVLAAYFREIQRATSNKLTNSVAARQRQGARQLRGLAAPGHPNTASGLIPHLHRLGSRKFARSRDNTIAPAVQAKKRVKVEDEIPF